MWHCSQPVVLSGAYSESADRLLPDAVDHSYAAFIAAIFSVHLLLVLNFPGAWAVLMCRTGAVA
jgi:hypothetical protein